MISRIIALIEKEQKLKFIWLGILVLIMGIFEVVGIGALIPFLDLVSKGKAEEIDGITLIIYEYLGKPDFSYFLILAGLAVLFMILTSNFMRALVLYLTSYFTWNNQASMSMRLHTSILKRPYEEFALENSAEASKDILVETEKFVTGLLIPLLTIFSQSVIVTAIIIVLCFYDLFISISVVISTLFIFGLFSFFIHRPLFDMGRQRFKATEKRYQSVDEALSGIKLIKLMHKEIFFADKLKKPSFDFAEAMAYMTVVRSLPRYIFEVIVFGLIILLVLFSIYQGNNIQAILPTLGLFAFAGYRLLPAVSMLYQAYNNLTFNSVVLDKLFNQRNLSTIHHEVKETSPIKNKPISKYLFSFENVSFQYKSSEKVTLRNLTLKLESPSFIGIVGTTGSGKSTFIDLLLGLIEPTAGTISLNGNLYSKDLRNDVSSRIGYVPQDIYLFDSSIKTNIGWGLEESDIDIEKVTSAAKLANIHEFITDQLPAGYESQVGERGAKLSGGQIQRIGIARALYNNPEILILDEGTSNLDQATESLILSNLRQDKKIKLIIIIAHRLKTTEECDYLLLFKDGLLTDQGTYEELSHTNKSFREMIKL